jgi:hypothetical protein
VQSTTLPFLRGKDTDTSKNDNEKNELFLKKNKDFFQMLEKQCVLVSENSCTILKNDQKKGNI